MTIERVRDITDPEIIKLVNDFKDVGIIVNDDDIVQISVYDDEYCMKIVKDIPLDQEEQRELLNLLNIQRNGKLSDLNIQRIAELESIIEARMRFLNKV